VQEEGTSRKRIMKDRRKEGNGRGSWGEKEGGGRRGGEEERRRGGEGREAE